MRYLYALCISLFVITGTHAQLSFQENAFQEHFDAAYQLYPAIPRGFLEAYSYHNTRLVRLQPEHEHESCSGMPSYHGVMGLIMNGKGYFNNNLLYIASLRHTDPVLLLQSPAEEIRHFAHAYNQVLAQAGKLQASPAEKLPLMLALCEIPQDGKPGNIYAREAMLFEWIKFLRNKTAAASYNFSLYTFTAEELLGSNSVIHHSGQVFFNEEQVWDAQGNVLDISKSADYAPAIWSPIPGCNYSSRSGTAVSAVTIHTVQGSYAGCISWFNNCSAGVSAHYVLRSSDGQVTQMVAESSKAWHVGTENPYTIGLEHEGYVNNAAWYTTAMYQSSANLVKDIVASGYGINALRTSWFPWAPTTNYNAASRPGSCVRIKGHQHYPNQTHTDPGANWNWDYYFKLIHPTPTATVYTAASGSFTDSGGAAGNYSNDQRAIYRIAPAGATTVSVSFSQFSLENTWDYLYVYDGSSIFSPLIGIYTGSTNPGTLVAASGSMTFEFRSDCATTAAGWQASWTSSTGGSLTDAVPPVTQLIPGPLWHTGSFQAGVSDSDSGSGIAAAFYRVNYRAPNGLRGNLQKGFLYEEFDTLYSSTGWTAYSGNWSMSSGAVQQSDESLANTNLAIALNQNTAGSYLYEFNASIGGSGNNRRAGFHFMCDSVQKTNRGNSYFIWVRESTGKLEFYKVTNDVFSLMADTALSTIPDQLYNYKVHYNKNTGRIQVWRDNIAIGSWTDASPLQQGNGVSFRSGNARMEVTHVQTYAERQPNTDIDVLVGPGGDIPVQNLSPSDAAGELGTLLIDQALNISTPAYTAVHVDWSPPSAPATLNDLYSSDADTVLIQPLQLAGNWNGATDTHSGIARYYYAIGTSAGNYDVAGWTDNWSLDSFTLNHTILPYQWYYLSVYAENAAGLNSDTVTSNGFIWIDDLGMILQKEIPFRIYPNPSGDGRFNFLWNTSQGDSKDLAVTDMNGRNVYIQQNFQGNTLHMPAGLANGMYILRVHTGKQTYFVRIELAR